MIISFPPDRPLGSFGPLARTDKSVGAVLPASALRGLRALGDAGDQSLAEKVFARQRPEEIGARSLTEPSAREAGGNRAVGDVAIDVKSLATTAELSSASLLPEQTIRAGTLSITVQGVAYQFALTGSQTLRDVARGLRGLGARLDADVRADDEGQERLVVTARDTGYEPTKGPDDALSITEVSTGSNGAALSLQTSREPTNAVLTVDGRTYVRKSNTISNIVDGTTLRLSRTGDLGASGRSPAPRGADADVPGADLSVELDRLLRAQLLKPGAQARSDEADGKTPILTAKKETAAAATFARRAKDVLESFLPPRPSAAAPLPKPLEDVDVGLALESELRPPALGSKTRMRSFRMGPRAANAYARSSLIAAGR